MAVPEEIELEGAGTSQEPSLPPEDIVQPPKEDESGWDSFTKYVIDVMLNLKYVGLLVILFRHVYFTCMFMFSLQRCRKRFFQLLRIGR